MKPWSWILGSVCVAALSLGVYTLEVTTQIVRHPLKHSFAELKPAAASKHQAAQAAVLRSTGTAPAIAASLDNKKKIAALTEAPAAASNKPAQLPENAPDNWQPVVEQVMHPSEAMGKEDIDLVKAAIAPISDTERQVDRAKVWQAVKGNPLQVMREAIMMPVWKNGRVIGLALQHVPEEGVLFQSGFKTGDIVQTVNGESVANPAFVLQMPEKLTHVTQIAVQVERDGQPLTLTYRMQ